MRNLRRILEIKLEDKISNEEVLELERRSVRYLYFTNL